MNWGCFLEVGRRGRGEGKKLRPSAEMEERDVGRWREIQSFSAFSPATSRSPSRGISLQSTPYGGMVLRWMQPLVQT